MRRIESRGAAIFDLDNTLVRGSSLFHFGLEMVRQRRIPLRHVLRFAAAETSYVWRRAEPSGIAPSVAERTLGLVAGLRQDELLDLATDFVERRLNRHLVAEVYLQVIDFTRAGYATFIATASPQELASSIACTLGMSGAVGTESEVIDGVYTGRLCGPVLHGPAKARRVAELLVERGLDPRESWAFSDSVNDLALLSMVGNPVATNPDRELRTIATRNGWGILPSGGGEDASLARLHSLYPFPM